MICALSVLIFLLGLLCIKKRPFLFDWNSYHCRRTAADRAAGNTKSPLPLHSFMHHTRRLWLCFQEVKESPLMCISTDAHSNGTCLTHAGASLCSA